jgi:pimeloyl-ACP methyl ester carboxylesterase
MPTCRVRGVDIAYDVRGTAGDPVVLIHGSLVDHRTWDRVAPALATSMEVVTYDRRGYGQSATAPSTHRVREDAADLAGLLEAIDVHPAHVVAQSYGGAVAIRLAIDRPEMVRSLALHEPPFIGLLAADPATASEGEEMLAQARACQRLARSGSPAAAAEHLVNVFSSEPGEWSRLPAAVQQTFARRMPLWAEEVEDPEAFLPDRVACRELMLPALLTYGSRSPRFLHRAVRDLGELLHNVQVLEIPGVGHDPQRAEPHQYVGLLVTFLLERNVPVS